jgi:hypothetical protein
MRVNEIFFVNIQDAVLVLILPTIIFCVIRYDYYAYTI